MQNNLSNKGLVAAGHKFAANISADTPLIDMAKMVSALATQLDAALAAAAEACKQRDQLAAENPISCNIIGRLIGQYSTAGYHAVQNSINPAESLLYDALQALKTPATDAYLNAVRAEGVELFATFQKKMAAQHDADNRTVWADERRISAEQATGFAAQLRAGNAGQDDVKKTINALPVERNQHGYWSHPDYLMFCDGREFISTTEFDQWASEHGLHWCVEYRDEEELEPNVDGYDLSTWQPKAPDGEGWFVGSIHDTEDGAVCIWLRAGRDGV